MDPLSIRSELQNVGSVARLVERHSKTLKEQIQDNRNMGTLSRIQDDMTRKTDLLNSASRCLEEMRKDLGKDLPEAKLKCATVAELKKDVVGRALVALVSNAVTRTDKKRQTYEKGLAESAATFFEMTEADVMAAYDAAKKRTVE